MRQASETFANLPEDKRQRVLDAAIEEFAEHGFQGASMNRLAARLAIAKGSIFQYFGSKEGLFGFAFGRAVELFKGPLKAARERARGQGFFEVLRQSLLAGMEFIAKHPRIHRIYLKMLHNEDFPLRERVLGQVRAASAKYFRPLVLEGIRRGELRADLDPDLAVYVLDTLLDRFLQSLAAAPLDGGLGVFGADRQTVERRAAELVEFLRRGLSA
jgi:AcrR family transcriptional regulator